MIKISQFLTNYKAETSPICLRVNHKGKYTRLATGLSLDTTQWDKDKKAISSTCKQAHSMRKILSNLELTIYEIAEKSTDRNGDLDLGLLAKKYRQIINGKESKDEGLYISDAFDLYIEDCMKKKEKRSTTAKVYKSIQNKIIMFENEIYRKCRIENMNNKYLNAFRLYLIEDCKITNITVHKHFKVLKSLTRFLISEGHKVNRDIFSFTISYNDTKKVTFNNSDMKKLIAVELKTMNHNKYRDLFVILCNIGLRISDLKKINESHINESENILSIHTDKTDTPVNIPVTNFVIGLLRKYFVSNDTNIIDQKFNKVIKEVCRLAGIDNDVEIIHEYGKDKVRTIYSKCDLITTHTGRRTFITKMMESGLLSESELMRVSGHKTIAAFRKYYQLDDIRIQKLCKQVIEQGLFED